MTAADTDSRILTRDHFGRSCGPPDAGCRYYRELEFRRPVDVAGRVAERP